MRNSKVLLVTGASSEIGCKTIEAIEGNYSLIFAHYRTMNDELELLKNKLGDKLALLQADFNDLDSTNEFMTKLSENSTKIDHCVFLPAVGIKNVKFTKCDWSAFEKEINISLRSTMMIAKSVLPAMAKDKYGKLVMMLSSCTLNNPPKYLGSYVPVKYAMLGLVKSLAAEYADKGITVNGISPEMIETKFLKDMASLVVEKNAADSPLGRNLTVDDVIPTINYLLSNGADAITGQNIAIMGGR